MNGADLDVLLRERRIIVCCGAGGVGKTTVSAALGLAAARRGRKTVVCTIDPAKRLANSLGISEFRNEETEVSPGRLAAAGVELGEGGSLHALMLDTKRTFDKLIESSAPSPEVAQRILQNHMYIQFSSQLAGSQEYMAMEKLYELQATGRYELLILDTPPTKHALDFLYAPKRLATFLDGSVLKWFTVPYFSAGRVGLGVAKKMAQKIMEWLDQIFGMAMLKELNEFFLAFESLWGGFKERADKVNALLRSKQATAFIVVTSPARDSVTEARYFIEQLRRHDMPLGGVVANRVHGCFLGAIGAGAGDAAATAPPRVTGVLQDALRSEEAATRIGTVLADSLRDDPALARAARKALANLYEFETLARADREHLDPLAREARAEGLFYREIPAFETDVYDVTGLARLDRCLLKSPVAVS